MKRHLSTFVLSALAVAAVGGLTVLRTGLVAEAAWRHDYTPLTVNTYPVSGNFTDISVTDYYADVQFRVSRDGSVSVVTRDAADVTHTVRVEGNTLTVTRPEPSVGQRLFHHDDDDPEVTIYLPAGNYGALTVSNTSGDIESAAQLGFASANLTTVSGDIDLNGPVSGKIVCNTTSGEVEGSLLSGKNFAVSSSIGRVSAPTADPAGAPCTVTTTSGDIRLTVRP